MFGFQCVSEASGQYDWKEYDCRFVDAFGISKCHVPVAFSCIFAYGLSAGGYAGDCNFYLSMI